MAHSGARSTASRVGNTIEAILLSPKIRVFAASFLRHKKTLMITLSKDRNLAAVRERK